MRRLLLALALLGVSAASADAQVVYAAKTGTITTAGTDCTIATNCVSLTGTERTGNGTIVLRGTWSGTVQFEGILDPLFASASWFALQMTPQGTTSFVTSATANGQWIVPMALRGVRIRASALASGTVTVDLAVLSASHVGGGGGGGSGTVTSIATTSPITGGTITTTGTIACATCVTSAASLTSSALVLGAGSQATSALASLGTTTTLLHGNAAGAPTFGSVVAGDLGANAVANAALAVVQTRRTCMIVVGADNGGLLVDADLGPQRKQCQVPYAATVVEIDVAADAGTPNVIVGVRHCTASACTTGANETVSNLVSSALAAGPGTGCAKTGATAGLDTFTTCVATLQNTTIAVGDFIELVSGTAGGTAKRMSIDVHYTVN